MDTTTEAREIAAADEVRRGLFALMAQTAKDLATIADDPATRMGIRTVGLDATEAFCRLVEAFVALEAVGWTMGEPLGALDYEEHGPAILAAIDRRLPDVVHDLDVHVANGWADSASLWVTCHHDLLEIRTTCECAIPPTDEGDE